jgi:hypothetical protein
MPRVQTETPQPGAATRQVLTANPVSLQAQLTDLRTRLTELEAQRQVIVQRTRAQEPVLRADAEKALFQLDLDLASVRAKVASLESQLNQNPLDVGSLIPPPAPPSSPPLIDPDAVTAVFLLTALAVLVPLSIGISRRLWRRPPVAPASALEDKVSPRLDRLEQAVDAIAIEVERISEGQRFVTKVMTERGSAVQPANAQVSNDGASLGEPKPFLALGAGPMEPIRAAERQAVKQSVTPH